MSTATAVLTTQQVADRLTELCREGKFVEAIQELYAPNIVSIEMHGSPGPERVEGFEAALAKTRKFGESVETMHSNVISDPIVADTYFAVSMRMDVTIKGQGRVPMDEIALYNVANGKIVSDQFFYSPMPSAN